MDVLNYSIEINKSLFTLRQVISALSENPNGKSYIPYRESKLTSLLKHSLGGNSYSFMFACINPLDAFLEENISTLNYALLAGTIANTPFRNEDPRLKLIQNQKDQIFELTNELSKANNHISLLT